jgi:hypothetical protein
MFIALEVESSIAVPSVYKFNLLLTIAALTPGTGTALIIVAT